MRLGLLWAGLAWLPTAVVPLYVLVNEHRLYLVSVAWALMVAAALGQPRLRRGVAIGGVGLYTILLACLGVQRTAVWADAATLWSDAAVKGPAMLKPQLRLADEWARQGQIDAAEAAYRRALALRPQHEAARNNLGRLYLQDRRWALAEAELRYLLAQYPDNVPGRLNLAKALIGQGDWQAAAACYKQVLAKEPTHGGALVALGHIALGANQDAAAALAYYDRALAVGQSGTDLLLSRGVALRGLGRLEEAAAAYRQVLEIDPKAGEAWFNLGNLLAAQGRRQEALGAYETAAKVAAGTPLGERAQGRLRTLLKEND